MTRWSGVLVAMAALAASLFLAAPAESATPAPLIKSLTPNVSSLAGGGKVTIVGSYLTGATKVVFGSTPGTALKVVSAHKLTVKAPPRASVGSVVVRVKAHGRWSNSALFTYQPNAQVVTTGYTSCMVKADRSGWCWGENVFGQVGQGNTTSPVLRPHELRGRWNWITVNDSTACGIATNGSTWCWGLAGDNEPRQVFGNWKTIAPGGYTICGIKSDDTLWCWGGNDQGQAGVGSTDPVPSPTAVGSGHWSSISNGSRTVCGIQTDTTAYCWGDDQFGAVGNAAAGTDATTPFALGSGWTSLTTTGFHTCGVQSGVGRCWGYNTSGQVGNGAAGPPPYPVVETPTQIVGSHAWTSLGLSSFGISCGVDSAAAGWCFGEGGAGALGAGSGPGATQSSTPLSVGPVTWKQIQPGASTTCGLATSGGLWCWGENGVGTVGDGTGTDRFVPTKLAGNWTSFAIGSSVVCGVRANNSVWCWGQNRWPGPSVTGAVGNGSTFNQTTPYHLPGT